jgi:hypothetical protein
MAWKAGTPKRGYADGNEGTAHDNVVRIGYIDVGSHCRDLTHLGKRDHGFATLHKARR